MRHSYHAHHAPPVGGPGSFLVGLNGAPGGFVSGATSGDAQDVFVGYRYPGEAWTLLPFVGAGTAARAGSALAVLPHGRYGRMFGWASDRWMAQALVFLLCTPFARARDAADLTDAQRRVLMTPAVHGLLDFDNGHMDVPVDLVFAHGGGTSPWKPLKLAGDGRSCVGWETAADGPCGFATSGAAQVCGFDDEATLGVRAVGLRFRLPAGSKAVFPLVLGWGSGLDRTFSEALELAAEARSLAQRRDEELRASGLPEDARRQISLATREALAAGTNRADLLLEGLQAAGAGNA